jgi:transcriptional regulator with XRE-family HTH domain
MANREEIGRRIRQARDEIGLSQTELGRLLSRRRSHAAISDLERGNVRVDAEELAELARILNKSVAYFHGTEPEQSVVYRRGDYGLTPEQQRETDRAVDEFRRFAREHARRSAGR